MKYLWRYGLSTFLMILGLTALLAAPSGPALAQEAVQALDQAWNAEFRDHLTFTLEAESTAEIVEVDLLYQVVGQVATSRNKADFTPGKSVEAEFTIDQTKPENYLPPGTELRYWWKVEDAAGNEFTTEKQTLLYLDDRYSWQTLENERLALYWYEGGDSFGEALFDRANEALDTLENDIGIIIENPIKIFIYADHRDLLGAISTSAQEWTGGQAFTDYGVVVIGIAPTQLNWGLNATTHEMSHLVIHQATDNPYGDLPRWLDEGIAVYNEGQDELVDDFRPVFEQAVEANELMTLQTLSSPFPSDPLAANLAYGQSGAVVKFIVDTYGPEAMGQLLEIFAEGALYDEALEQALSVDTVGLDNAFRASLGLEPLPGTEPQVATEPEVIVSEEEPSESAGEITEETTTSEEPSAPVENADENIANEEEPVSEAEPQPAEEAPAPAPEENERESPVGALPCLAGLIPLAVFGLGVTLRRGS